MQSNPKFEDRETTVGAYMVDLSFEHVSPAESVSDDNVISSCFISRYRDGVEYSASLGVLETFGTIENDFGDALRVPQVVIDRVTRWASDNGY